MVCNVGMNLRLKQHGAIFKFDNGIVVHIKKNGDRYEIKKKKEKNKINENCHFNKADNCESCLYEKYNKNKQWYECGYEKEVKDDVYL